MKYLFAIILITLSCSSPVEEEFYEEVKLIFCTIQVDGANYKKISDCCYGSGCDLRWLGNDSLLMMKTDDIVILDIKGNRIKQIRRPQDIISFDVSDNGSMIVLSCSDPTGADLYLVELDNYEIIQLTYSPLIVEQFPRFSKKKVIKLFSQPISEKEQLVNHH